jgi:hypothetical protein
VALTDVDPGRRFAGTCIGWSTRNTCHRRIVEVGAEGVAIDDSVEGHPRGGRLTLPLAPGLEPSLQGATARLRLGSGVPVRIDMPRGLAWRVERLPYFPEFGLRLERAALVADAERLARHAWRISCEG